MTAQHSFFRRFVRHETEPARGDDPADLGTAFGLDASLGPLEAHDGDDDEADDDGTPRSEHAPMDWLGQLGKPKR